MAMKKWNFVTGKTKDAFEWFRDIRLVYWNLKVLKVVDAKILVDAYFVFPLGAKELRHAVLSKHYSVRNFLGQFGCRWVVFLSDAVGTAFAFDYNPVGAGVVDDVEFFELCPHEEGAVQIIPTLLLV